MKLITQNKKLSLLLQNNIAYLDNELYGLFANEGQDVETSSQLRGLYKLDTPKPIIIVAKKHYSESWKTYSAISLKELKQILKLQHSKVEGAKPIQRIITNKEQDGFDVHTIVFHELIQNFISAKAVLLPETELLANFFNLNKKSVAEVETPAGTLFWAHSGGKTFSAYKKGLLSNISNFLQGVGLPENADVYSINAEQYTALLFELIETTTLDKLLAIASINFTNAINKNKLHQLYLAPLLVATIFSVSVSGYFYMSKSMLLNDISDNRAEAMALMESKRKIDTIESTLSSVNSTFKEVENTHQIWALVYKVINDGMEVSRFKRTEKGVELTGRAEKASFILGELNKMPSVSGATFSGDIRKSRGMDSFTILLQFDTTKHVVSSREKNES
ncbi:hypothetical protein [Colwellia sp. D2M02]|uniref:hypothetical protein n=1 Tax=Colwellia sp. D2M02 TaxID=2841562 RepID=UPI001C09F7A2|nr:hypothetical protein [Colwellia sp. D2M02]